MIDNPKRIGDILGLKQISHSDGSEELIGMQLWYNEMLTKKPNELSSFDVIRMLGQNVLLDVAIPCALEMLQANPFTGDLFEGQMLALVMEKMGDFSPKEKHVVSEIICKAIDDIDQYNWLFDDEKADCKKRLGLWTKF